MKPIRTEYAGVVFDSKSEAVFARTLHLGGHNFVYHPGVHCGHAWDFLVRPVGTINQERVLRFIVGGTKFFNLQPKLMLVEYKPSMPTMTYVENLTNQMRDEPLESVIVWGNPWDGPNPNGETGSSYNVYPIFSSFHHDIGWGDFDPEFDSGRYAPISLCHPTWDVLGITEEMAQQAKKYRFDLAHQQSA